MPRVKKVSLSRWSHREYRLLVRCGAAATHCRRINGILRRKCQPPRGPDTRSGACAAEIRPCERRPFGACRDMVCWAGCRNNARIVAALRDAVAAAPGVHAAPFRVTRHGCERRFSVSPATAAAVGPEFSPDTSADCFFVFARRSPPPLRPPCVGRAHPRIGEIPGRSHRAEGSGRRRCGAPRCDRALARTPQCAPAPAGGASTLTAAGSAASLNVTPAPWAFRDWCLWWGPSRDAPRPPPAPAQRGEPWPSPSLLSLLQAEMCSFEICVLEGASPPDDLLPVSHNKE